MLLREELARIFSRKIQYTNQSLRHSQSRRRKLLEVKNIVRQTLTDSGLLIAGAMGGFQSFSSQGMPCLEKASDTVCVEPVANTRSFLRPAKMDNSPVDTCRNENEWAIAVLCFCSIYSQVPRERSSSIASLEPRIEYTLPQGSRNSCA